MVETVGIEPMTSCMSSMRSNQLSYASATDGIIPYAEGFVKGFLKSFLEFYFFFRFRDHSSWKVILASHSAFNSSETKYTCSHSLVVPMYRKVAGQSGTPSVRQRREEGR